MMHKEIIQKQRHVLVFKKVLSLVARLFDHAIPTIWPEPRIVDLLLTDCNSAGTVNNKLFKFNHMPDRDMGYQKDCVCTERHGELQDIKHGLQAFSLIDLKYDPRHDYIQRLCRSFIDVLPNWPRLKCLHMSGRQILVSCFFLT